MSINFCINNFFHDTLRPRDFRPGDSSSWTQDLSYTQLSIANQQPPRRLNTRSLHDTNNPARFGNQNNLRSSTINHSRRNHNYRVESRLSRYRTLCTKRIPPFV